MGRGKTIEQKTKEKNSSSPYNICVCVCVCVLHRKANFFRQRYPGVQSYLPHLYLPNIPIPRLGAQSCLPVPLP